MTEAAESASPEPGPAVLVVGGLLTSWLWYWPVRRSLACRGASRVEIAPVWLWQWVVAGFVGPGRAASVVAAAIDRLSFEDRRRIMVVGHSGGGILARLALASRSYNGTHLASRDAVGALVTLGTPHLATRFGGTIGLQGLRALRFLQEPDQAPSPGDPWVTMSVGGRLPDDPPYGGSPPNLRRRFSAMCYKALLGASGPGFPGDGLVPQPCALLPSGETLRLDGIAHAPLLGSPWYFSDEGIGRWWGPARRAWHDAVIGASTAGPNG
jgi:hypothetical protein